MNGYHILINFDSFYAESNFEDPLFVFFADFLKINKLIFVSCVAPIAPAV